MSKQTQWEEFTFKFFRKNEHFKILYNGKDLLTMAAFQNEQVSHPSLHRENCMLQRANHHGEAN